MIASLDRSSGVGQRLGGLAILVLVAVAVSACGGGGTSSSTARRAPGLGSDRPHHRSTKPAEREREHGARKRAHDRRAARGAARKRQPASLGCPDPAHVLDGVYHPDRLVVHEPCRKITGSVEDVRDEEDGDIHILVRLDSQYRDMLMPNNFSVQHGDLVVEFMPRDYGHLPRPSVGDRLTLVGAYVDDTEHGWAELHPVWTVSINGGAAAQSGPQYGGSPAYARSDDAVATCRTNTGARCRGYNGEVAPAPDDESQDHGGEGGGGSQQGSSGGDCTPGYSPCLPPASDYDCQGGTGDGPEYTGRVQVTGSDPYDLDSDGNGVGCE